MTEAMRSKKAEQSSFYRPSYNMPLAVRRYRRRNIWSSILLLQIMLLAFYEPMEKSQNFTRAQ